MSDTDLPEDEAAPGGASDPGTEDAPVTRRSRVRVLGEPADPEERPADADSPARPGGGLLLKPVVVMFLLAVALAGVAGTAAFGLLWARNESSQSNAKQIQSASRTVAVRFLRDFTTFSPSTVGATFSDIESISTGSFASQAKEEFNAELKSQLEAANASTKGTIEYLYIQAYSSQSATYFADVGQTFSNKSVTSPQSDELRLVIDLSRVRGQWKISEVTSLDNPTTSGASG